MKTTSPARYSIQNRGYIMNNSVSKIISSVGERVGDIAVGAVSSVPGVSAVDAFTGGAISGAVKQGVQAATQNINAQLNSGGSSPVGKLSTNGSSGGTSKFEKVSYGSGGGSFLSGRLDLNPNPYKFTLSTGIKNTAYAPLYHDGDGNNSPLHVTGVKLAIPYNSELRLSNFFNNVVGFYFTNALQSAVSFAVDLTKVSGVTLVNAMNSVINALCIYFTYKSILTYCSDPNNRNAGMLNLRNTISAEQLNQFYELDRVLRGTPMPPNLVNLCWYLCQNVASGDIPGCAVLKIFPNVLMYAENGQTLCNYGIGFDDNNCANAIVDLQTYRSTFTILARATNWMNNDLPGYPSTPVYDCDFKTVWVNLPMMSGSTDYLQNPLPQVVDLTSTNPVQYQSHCNTLDGAAFALTSMYAIASGVWVPSLISPQAIGGGSNTFNRYSYFGGGSWMDMCNLSNGSYFSFAAIRGETYNPQSLGRPTAGDYNGLIYLGAQTTLGVSQQAVTESTLQLTEWMMSLGTIGKLDDKRTYNGVTSPMSTPKFKGKRRGK